MIIYKDLYKTCARNFNTISDHFGLKHIEPSSYEDFCLSVHPAMFNNIAPWNKGNVLEAWDKQKKSKALKQYHKENPEAARLRSKRSEESCAKVRKTYKLISPHKEIIITSHLIDFCKRHNLNQGNMVSVASGKLKSHKGWICSRM